MQDIKFVTTSLRLHLKLVTDLSPQRYAMVCSRPYASHAVSVVNRFIGKLGKRHWQAMKWILQHRKSIDIGLTYEIGAGTSCNMLDFFNSNFVSNLDYKRSQMEYVCTLLRFSISWKTFLQSIITLSITELECTIMPEAVEEA